VGGAAGLKIHAGIALAATNERKTVYSYGYRRSPDQDAAKPVRRPVVVVGAGPVGLAAAIALAKSAP